MSNPQPSLPPPSPETLSALKEDLDALYAKTLAQLGDRELRHLRRIERVGWLLSLLGWATAWIFPNPLSALAMAQGSVSRWAIVAHHVLHRGYDRIASTPARLTSKGFATGWRRWIDWPDWIIPEAWCFEHNVLHHGHTGEPGDPDVAETVFQWLRETKAPRALKLFLVGVSMCTWRFIYYAPNTLWTIRKRREMKSAGADRGGFRLDEVHISEPTNFYHGAWLLLPFSAGAGELWLRCYLPYIGLRFGLLPLPFLLLGTGAWLSTLATVLMAEIFANIISFLIIVPNHSGEDLYRFDGPAKSRAELYYRQIVGSTNYTGGTELSDMLQGYLNYQIEHHLWPSLPALSYRDMQPEVEAICAKHGVPYVNEPLALRVKKTVALLIGEASMRTFAEPEPIESGPTPARSTISAA